MLLHDAAAGADFSPDGDASGRPGVRTLTGRQPPSARAIARAIAAHQRSKIQEENLHYEMVKHTGEYAIVGVNAFRNPHGDPVPETIELARSTEEEKQSQLARLRDFQARHAGEAPAMLERLKAAVIANLNVFAVLMDAVRCCSLGQITNAVFEVGGQYRRSM